MQQLSFIGEVQPVQKKAEPTSKKQKSRQQATQSQPKRIAPVAISKVEIQPESFRASDPKPSPYGSCRVCERAISIPGLDASLCSNLARTCGSSGWVVDPQWLASQGQKGGKTNG